MADVRTNPEFHYEPINDKEQNTSMNYEELDYRQTPIGELLLRRRRLLQLGGLEVYEVKLGDYFLMSSLFHDAEVQLAKLGLGALERSELDVVVGGLGLGYTAVAALEDKRIRSLVVVEYLEGVIDWHRTGLVPLGSTLTKDARCQLVNADFFAMSHNVSQSFDPENPMGRHDAILLDIDHTPSNVLHQTNTRFYTKEGLRELSLHLKPGGVFALWADGAPEDAFTAQLGKVFETAEAHTITFENPVLGGTSEGAVYVAKVKE